MKCPECGSKDTKKAKTVRDAGTSSGNFGGVGVGTGGLGLGLGSSRSKTELAKSAEQREEAFGLSGFFTGILFIGAAILSFYIGSMVAERYEILAGIIAGIVSLGLMSWLLPILAAILAMTFAAAIVMGIAAYVGEEYSWWVGGPLGIILAIGALSATWENIKNVFADFYHSAADKEYKKTWVCLTCSNRWVKD